MNGPRLHIALFGALLLLPLQQSSGEVNWAAVHELTVRGLDRLYNLEINRSIATFDTVCVMAPGDPRGYFFRSMAHFLLYSLNREQKEFDIFLEQSDTVVTVCEGILDNNENDATAHFYLGGILGYRGLGYQANGSILKAVNDGRKGVSHLEEAIRQDPKLYDAYMGFGLFRYLIAKIPKSLRWILNIIGFEGDLEGGLKALKVASEKGMYCRTEASFFLAQFLFSEHRYDEAFTYLNPLIEKYPRNTLFLVSYASWQSRLNKNDEALRAATRALELNEQNNVRYGEQFAFSTIGNIYYARNDFANAAKYLASYVQIDKTNRQNWSYYRLGVAREMTGDRQGALEAYRNMTGNDASDRPNDAYLYRQGIDRIRRPMNEADALLIRASNESALGSTDSARAHYDQALQKSGSDDDLQARALYGIQQILFNKREYADVVALSPRLLALKPLTERWIIPHGYFQLGQAYARLGNPEEARKAFRMVGTFDNYDFQSRLEEHVDEEMKNL